VREAVEIARFDDRPFAAARRLDPAGGASVPDPTEVARAQAHVARDAAEVRRPGSALFAAVEAQEGTRPLTWLDPLPPGP
jgi:hypothetical protein